MNKMPKVYTHRITVRMHKDDKKALRKLCREKNTTYAELARMAMYIAYGICGDKDA